MYYANCKASWFIVLSLIYSDLNCEKTWQYFLCYCLYLYFYTIMVIFIEVLRNTKKI